MITTLDNLKTRLKMDLFDTAEDTILNNFIKHCGDRFEQECNRIFTRAVATTHEFSADTLAICPPRFPIESVSAWALKTDETEGWVVQTGVSYLLRSAGEVVSIISLLAPLGTGGQVARITYTGGYVMPGSVATTGQTALPDGLEQAAIEQIAAWYRDKDRAGLASVSGSGGSVSGQQMSVVNQLDLLPQVANLLKGFERWLP